ncbi:TetR/AcrR family transcriptional regulator [Nocardioides alcanivorans]|uniref:TetR/AcrR family transcriptional regulator n=1 Tax=Nocardioides alcanivorans TaxID=2897352 RepID=UPI001F2551CC|nr:TetR/AcrR family transcriptional regulator [Nocardioides alcanivorans]
MSRADNRAQNVAAILAAARTEIVAHGGGGLSMRAVAREVGLVSSAVYRYFPTREALLTAMIIESYGHLADALEAGRSGRRTPATQWLALARSLRTWAVDHPHEFQLIYGTPIPGYVAPPETIPAAEAVVRPFLEAGAANDVEAFSGRKLAAQLGIVQEITPDATTSGIGAVLAEIAGLVGLLTLELAGHFVGTADPADHLFEATLQRQLHTLGIS